MRCQGKKLVMLLRTVHVRPPLREPHLAVYPTGNTYLPRRVFVQPPEASTILIGGYTLLPENASIIGGNLGRNEIYETSRVVEQTRRTFSHLLIHSCHRHDRCGRQMSIRIIYSSNLSSACLFAINNCRLCDPKFESMILTFYPPLFPNELVSARTGGFYRSHPWIRPRYLVSGIISGI